MIDEQFGQALSRVIVGVANGDIVEAEVNLMVDVGGEQELEVSVRSEVKQYVPTIIREEAQPNS